MIENSAVLNFSSTVNINDMLVCLKPMDGKLVKTGSSLEAVKSMNHGNHFRCVREMVKDTFLFVTT